MPDSNELGDAFFLWVPPLSETKVGGWQSSDCYVQLARENWLKRPRWCRERASAES